MHLKIDFFPHHLSILYFFTSVLLFRIIFGTMWIVLCGLHLPSLFKYHLCSYYMSVLICMMSEVSHVDAALQDFSMRLSTNFIQNYLFLIFLTFWVHRLFVCDSFQNQIWELWNNLFGFRWSQAESEFLPYSFSKPLHLWGHLKGCAVWNKCRDGDKL